MTAPFTPIFSRRVGPRLIDMEAEYTTPGAQLVAVPLGAVSVTIEGIGGGKVGSYATDAGGGGGAYSKKTVTDLTGITSLYLSVPDYDFADGSDRDVYAKTNSAGGTTLMLAKGGGTDGTVWHGGQASAGVGDVRYSGGNGAHGVTFDGGGGAAGPNGVGSDTSGVSGGASGGSPAGSGGSGGGFDGNSYGGGGGVRSDEGSEGAGAPGWARLRWKVLQPSLTALDLAAETVDSRVTVAGAANGTRIDSTGTLVAATTPRWSYGDAPTNLLTYTEQFDASVWNKQRVTVALAGNIVAPNGTYTATKVTENTVASNQHFLYFTRTGSSETVTCSIYAKAAERTKCGIQLSNFSTAAIEARFDLSAGTVTLITATNADYTNPSATITPVGDGWYRLSLTATKAAINTVNNPAFELCDATGNPVYTGDGVSGMYIWGAQLEAGSSLSPYAARFDGSGFRKNWIRNSTMAGAVAGSIGSLPTNWAGSTNPNGLTRTVVGTGTENGIDYIDIRFSGTPSASGNLSMRYEALNFIAAASGQPWSTSAYCSLVGGSWTNVGVTSLNVIGMDATPTQVEANSTVFTPTSGPLDSCRITSTRVMSIATTAWVTAQFVFTYTSGNAIDFTVRIGRPQLEMALAASPAVATSGVAVSVAQYKRGLLIEGQRTNAIRNPVMAGAVAADGVERVTNGTFTGTTGTGWTAVQPGTSTVNFGTTGQCTITGDGTNLAYIYQSIATVAGLTYTVSATVAGNPVAVNIGTTQHSANLLATVAQANAGVSQKFQFTATGTTTWIEFARQSSGGTTISAVSTQSAGKVPTNWAVGLGANPGTLISSIVGTGTANGIPYIDLRLSGTPAGTGQAQIQYEVAGTVAASSGQAWTVSSYLTLAPAIQAAGVSGYALAANERSAGFLQFDASAALTVGKGPLIAQRPTYTFTVGNASTTNILPMLAVNYTAAAIDITLRIGLPRLEQIGFATSDTAGAGAGTVTRTVDSLTLSGAGFSSLINPAGGAVVAEFLLPQFLPTGANSGVFEIDDGSFNNAIAVYVTSTGIVRAVWRSGGVQLATLDINNGSVNQVMRVALKWGAGKFAFSSRGSAVVSATPSAQPIGLNRLTVGDIANGQKLEGFLRGLWIWNNEPSASVLPLWSA